MREYGVYTNFNRYLKNNPRENEKDLRSRLEISLADYKKGIKCSCGNAILVIGSASIGNSCFTCFTGEDSPRNNYEIEAAITKNINIENRRNIDDILS